MKKLLFSIALLFFLSLNMFAQLMNPGDTTGTLITAAIRPNSQADDMATVYTNEVRGGLHNYNTWIELENEKPSRLVPGMLATVNDSTGKLYQCKITPGGLRYTFRVFDFADTLAQDPAFSTAMLGHMEYFGITGQAAIDSIATDNFVMAILTEEQADESEEIEVVLEVMDLLSGLMDGQKFSMDEGEGGPVLSWGELAMGGDSYSWIDTNIFYSNEYPNNFDGWGMFQDLDLYQNNDYLIKSFVGLDRAWGASAIKLFNNSSSVSENYDYRMSLSLGQETINLVAKKGDEENSSVFMGQRTISMNARSGSEVSAITINHDGLVFSSDGGVKIDSPNDVSPGIVYSNINPDHFTDTTLIPKGWANEQYKFNHIDSRIGDTTITLDFSKDEALHLTLNNTGGNISFKSPINVSSTSSKKITIYLHATTSTTANWPAEWLYSWKGSLVGPSNFVASERGILTIQNFSSTDFVCEYEEVYIAP